MVALDLVELSSASHIFLLSWSLPGMLFPCPCPPPMLPPCLSPFTFGWPSKCRAPEFHQQLPSASWHLADSDTGLALRAHKHALWHVCGTQPKGWWLRVQDWVLRAFRLCAYACFFLYCYILLKGRQGVTFYNEWCNEFLPKIKPQINPTGGPRAKSCTEFLVAPPILLADGALGANSGKVLNSLCPIWSSSLMSLNWFIIWDPW